MKMDSHAPRKTEPGVVGLPSSSVWKLIGVAPSTLNYWVQVGLVTPSLRTPHGRRVEQWWTIEEVVIAQSIRALRKAGVSLNEVRRIAAQLTSAGSSLASSSLYYDAGGVTIVDEAGRIEATKHPLQGMLFLVGLPLKEWHKRASSTAVLFDRERYATLDTQLDERRLAQQLPMKRVAINSPSARDSA